MLEAHDEIDGTKSSSYLSYDIMVSTIMTMLLAAYETTADALSCIAYLL